MIDTGCLTNVRGALIPSDRLIDEADAGRIHSVIASRFGNPVFDSRTGEPAMRDTGNSGSGDAVFIGGSMRRLVQGSDGTSFLAGSAARARPLARISAAGPGIAVSRNIIWGMARQLGIDPTIWQLTSGELRTWGGELLNRLVAAFLERSAPGSPFTPSAMGVRGSVSSVELSIAAIRRWAIATERQNDLPLKIAEKFTNSNQFLNELSDELSAEEKRRSVPWSNFHHWLSRVGSIELVD